MAEAVLRDHTDDLDLAVASAGTSDEEEGNPMDPRAASVLAEHGFPVTGHVARQVTPSDLEAGLILTMTRQQRRALLSLGADPARTRLWSEFIPDRRHPDVADPWYGDRTDFEETLAVIEAGVPGILAEVGAAPER